MMFAKVRSQVEYSSLATYSSAPQGCCVREKGGGVRAEDGRRSGTRRSRHTPAAEPPAEDASRVREAPGAPAFGRERRRRVMFPRAGGSRDVVRRVRTAASAAPHGAVQAKSTGTSSSSPGSSWSWSSWSSAARALTRRASTRARKRTRMAEEREERAANMVRSSVCVRTWLCREPETAVIYENVPSAAALGQSDQRAETAPPRKHDTADGTVLDGSMTQE